MAETTIKNNILRMIRKEFPEVWAYKASDRFQSGIPDILMCVGNDSTFAAIEVKTATGRVSEIQKYTIEKIKSVGGYACVCRSVDEARKFIWEVIKHGRAD
jgi:hypothetical protein